MARRSSSPTDNTRREVLAVLGELQSGLDRLAELLAASLIDGAADRIRSPAMRPPPPEQPDWKSLEQAAAVVGVGAETMANYCRLHGLGWRPAGGRWKVDLARVRRWINREPFEPLPAVMPEETGETGKNPDARATTRRRQ